LWTLPFWTPVFKLRMIVLIGVSERERWRKERVVLTAIINTL
jgi:hypothetical protein